MWIDSTSIEMEPVLDAFYNLKKKIVELSVDDETTKSLMESLASLEHEITRTQHEAAPSLDEIDMMICRHREPSDLKKVAGPSKAMQNYVKNEQVQSARRIDWVIAYGKLCNARCDLAEAEAEEKRLSDLYLKYIN
jgi:hypothetical protein